jgi:uncharacterized protein (TIGR03437 family)
VPRLLLALLAISPLTAQLIVDTYAGGVIRSGVPANNVALGNITGITWDPSGNIVFSDRAFNVIRRVRTDGIIETIAGTGAFGFAGDGGPAIGAMLNYPQYPQYDAAGNLYFLDSSNYRIRRIDTSGVITTIAGDGQSPIGGLESTGPALSRPIAPSFYAVDPSGIVYLSDNGGNLLRVTASGNLEFFVQIPFMVPGGLATDAMGNVYFLNQYEDYYEPQTLYRVTPSGIVSTFATFNVNSSQPPPGNGFLTSDLAGNIYTFFNGHLLRYAPDGTSTAIPTPVALLNSPFAAIDSSGNIAFGSSLIPAMSTANISVIQKFTAQSVVTTLAGDNPQPAPDGTPLRNAWFLGPISIAFGPTGDLYISEAGACLIRKISAAGILSTFAGTGTCGSRPLSGNAKTVNLAEYPYSLAVDSTNNVWIGPNLYSISQDGVISGPVPLPTVPQPFVLSINAIAFDAKDRLYIQGMMSLYRLSGNTWQTIVAPPADIGSASTPLFGLGANSSGNVYFSEQTNTYIVNDDGTFTLKYPNYAALALAFDPTGNIWGSSIVGNLITSNPSGVAHVGFGPTGSYLGFAGDGGPLQSAVLGAYGSIAFGPDGNLYFVDNGIRIRRVTGSAPSAPPVISQGGIVNAVSYAPGLIAAGELISIFGSNFGATSLQVNPAINNSIPFTLGRTKVLFNGQPGAIVAITPTQINVFVPHEITTPVTVQVQVDNILSTPFTIPVAATAPGLSPSILNQDGTLNTAANPAPHGSIVSFYGTGLGQMTPQLNDGNLAISTPYSIPINTPTLTIGNQPAQILYAGDAPTLPTGVFQINAMIPANINPGPASVSLTVAGASTEVQLSVK